MNGWYQWSPALYDWFDFQNASFELLDGDAEILPGLSVITTPGHTSGHQSVLVAAEDGGPDLLIGDAAYTPCQYRPEPGRLPPGQATDEDAWHASVNRMRALTPARVHFCHHTDVVHGQGRFPRDSVLTGLLAGEVGAGSGGVGPLTVMDPAPRPVVGLNRESPRLAGSATCMRGGGSGRPPRR